MHELALSEAEDFCWLVLCIAHISVRWFWSLEIVKLILGVLEKNTVKKEISKKVIGNNAEWFVGDFQGFLLRFLQFGTVKEVFLHPKLARSACRWEVTSYRQGNWCSPSDLFNTDTKYEVRMLRVALDFRCLPISGFGVFRIYRYIE